MTCFFASVQDGDYTLVHGGISSQSAVQGKRLVHPCGALLQIGQDGKTAKPMFVGLEIWPRSHHAAVLMEGTASKKKYLALIGGTYTLYQIN